jgi:delta14-sterol reductase
VPFLYTLQAKYLYYNPSTASSCTLATCAVLHFLGYALFRGANTQKDRFRTNPADPRVAHLKVMKTSAGKSLIISGFWGVCRHPNYVGDWLMTLAWSMLAGGSHALLPYFQPIYFAILLIHRQLRDEEQMLEKYGAVDWERYCKHVPHRLIPYVY